MMRSSLYLLESQKQVCVYSFVLKDSSIIFCYSAMYGHEVSTDKFIQHRLLSNGLCGQCSH